LINQALVDVWRLPAFARYRNEAAQPEATHSTISKFA
jgi:hypothetical protein